MKILCFGDSLTWGYTPYGGRYAQSWPDVLKKCRPQDTIISAGQPGRTAYGSELTLSSLLQRYEPDITCIMLGSNDLSLDCGRTIEQVCSDLKKMSIESSKYGRVILMTPPSISEDVDPGWNYPSGISSMMKKLADQISLLCKRQNLYFFNTQNIVRPAVPDGLHIDQESHLILGKEMAAYISGIIRKDGN